MAEDAVTETTEHITFDQVEIDRVGRRLLVGGTPVPLEPKAFDVLALLARNPGRAFTRDEILDGVWGHRHVTPGVLNRIITLLRHALGESAQRTQYIRTLHGVGYRFDAAVRSGTQRKTGDLAADGPDKPAEPQSPTLPGESTPDQAIARQDAARDAESSELHDIARQRHPPVAEIVLPQGTSNAAAARKFALAVLLLVCFFGVLGLALWLREPIVRPRPESVQEQGVAVLPLANVARDPSQQFFTDGISESLINTLTQYAGLKVIGRSSAFRFRDSQEGARVIGTKLGVSHLIEGSVQRSGDELRIVVELVRVSDGSTVWTQRFDRPYKELFATQDEIALAVSAALQVKLLHSTPSSVDWGRPGNGDLDAYNEYLQGTYYFRGGNDFRKAIEHFSQATQLYPGYAQAWSWLGHVRTLYTLGSLSGDAARASYAQAREEIDTALRLWPKFGQAHAIHANWLRTANHDWNGALAEFRIALPLVPETDPTHGAYSILLSALGRVNEAIAERSKFIAGDPLAAYARIYLANLQASIGRLDEAEASLREAAEIQPEQTDWYASERSEFAILRGDARAAIAEASSMASSHWKDRVVALATQISGDDKVADTALRKLIQIEGQSKRDSYAIARVYALRGEADKAFEWLQRDWEHDATAVQEVLFDPLLLRFRDDPRLAAYCARAGLPSPASSEALSLDQIRARLNARR